ncbi:MAG: DUF378 domain-containing protein [Candidatus Pacebacteria bacterium]|nr:DUF378 domain-containing protein [Candidatus Paceibacterota bacterium]
MCNLQCAGGKCGCCPVAKTAKVLLVIGGLNWGLVGLGVLMGQGLESLNVVHLVLGNWPIVEGIVYILVGLAAVLKIFGCRCKKCKAACSACAAEDKKDEKVEAKM